ncbi:LysE family transporter [Micromonospora endolithica]|uniref:Lysine transporter LysE n=1 Tax=Micromonospora endolithica TaxID=230091 RepID=A0A3A9ZT34_9ACTN|nr:LysE family transporter [Micromonospora endolithica]RKN51293.1 lysine transporter LysE [Micromonospora endolithica]
MVAGFGVAIPVGAIAVLVMGLAARTSFRVGAAAALGVATADGLYAAVAAIGGVALAATIAPVAGPLRVVAAVVLLGLAAHTACRALRPAAVPAAERPGMDSPSRAFAGLLALTLLNPATVVYFAALVLGRRDAADPDAGTAGAFVLGAFLASASWQLLVAGSGTLVGRVLAGRRGRLVTALVSSAVIATLALTMLLAG